MMRQRARYSSSETWSRERFERLRLAHGTVGSSKGKEGAVVVGELRASKAIFFLMNMNFGLKGKKCERKSEILGCDGLC